MEPPAQRQSGRTPTLGRNTRARNARARDTSARNTWACNAWTGSARGVVGMSLARQRGNVMNRLKFPVSPIDAVAKRPRGKLKIDNQCWTSGPGVTKSGLERISNK